jgi:hypothetical protein
LYSLGVATSGGRIWSEEQGTFVELGQSLWESQPLEW